MTSTQENLFYNFKELYRNFNQDQVALIDDVYDKEIRFSDPVHEVSGLEAMKSYFNNIASNLNYCRFEYLDEVHNGNSSYIKWLMIFSHPHLKNGEEIRLKGVSHIQYENKIYLHEDFYDMGAMIYEHLPLLSHIVKNIKYKLKH